MGKFEIQIQEMINNLSVCLEDAKRIDEKTYGWKAGCSRVRKCLSLHVGISKEMRKEIQAHKNEGNND